MIWRNTRCESGFSLMELLMVLTIVGIVGGISLMTWESYYPQFALNQGAQQLASDLTKTAYRAASTQNRWFVYFLYTVNPANTVKLIDEGDVNYQFSVDSYIIANDDGWLGTPPRLYILGSSSFAWAHRNNRLLNSNEMISGPIKLGRNIKFYFDYYNSPADEFFSPDKIHFLPNWTTESQRIGIWPLRPKASVFIVDQHYVAGDNSPDNRKHRRRIRVQPTAKIQISLT